MIIKDMILIIDVNLAYRLLTHLTFTKEPSEDNFAVGKYYLRWENKENKPYRYRGGLDSESRRKCR